jgi:hypothetical protein
MWEARAGAIAVLFPYQYLSVYTGEPLLDNPEKCLKITAMWESNVGESVGISGNIRVTW